MVFCEQLILFCKICIYLINNWSKILKQHNLLVVEFMRVLAETTLVLNQIATHLTCKLTAKPPSPQNVIETLHDGVCMVAAIF